MTDALELLKTRHSYKPTDILPDGGPSAAELETILTIASRVPDHGKLAPWRFIVFEGEARARAGDIAAKIFATKNPQATPDQIEFQRGLFLRTPLVVGIVSRTVEHPKIPRWEQEMSAGCSMMNMLLASYAQGYVGCILTEWIADDRDMLTALGLAAEEKMAAFVYIGKPARPTESRPRPALAEIVTRF